MSVCVLFVSPSLSLALSLSLSLSPPIKPGLDTWAHNKTLITKHHLANVISSWMTVRWSYAWAHLDRGKQTGGNNICVASGITVWCRCDAMCRQCARKRLSRRMWSSFNIRGPQMGGQIRRGWIRRFWGAPIFRPEVPKPFRNRYLGTSGLKIGAPQKRQILPRRIWPPICGPLINREGMSHLCDSTVAGQAVRRENALESQGEYPPFCYPPFCHPNRNGCYSFFWKLPFTPNFLQINSPPVFFFVIFFCNFYGNSLRPPIFFVTPMRSSGSRVDWKIFLVIFMKLIPRKNLFCIAKILVLMVNQPLHM